MRIDDRPLERIAFGIKEGAESIGIGVTQMRELIAAGAIPVFHIGRRILLRKSDLRAFADSLFDRQNCGGDV